MLSKELLNRIPIKARSMLRIMRVSEASDSVKGDSHINKIVRGVWKGKEKRNSDAYLCPPNYDAYLDLKENGWQPLLICKRIEAHRWMAVIKGDFDSILEALEEYFDGWDWRVNYQQEITRREKISKGCDEVLFLYENNEIKAVVTDVDVVCEVKDYEYRLAFKIG